MSLITEFEPGFTASGGLPWIVAVRQTDSMTFTQGQAVTTASATGSVSEVADNGVVAFGISSMNADNDTVNRKVGIWVSNHDTIFKATAHTPGNVTVASIFLLMDHNVTTGTHAVNENASDDDIWYCVDITAVGGRVFVKAGESQYSGAPAFGIT